MPKNRNSTGSIAEAVLNTSNPHDINGSLTAAHQALTGEGISPLRLALQAEMLSARSVIEGLFMDNSSDHSMYLSDANFTERRITSAALRNIFVERELKFNTMLNSWPLFDHLARRHGRGEEAPHSRALLVGSLTSLTSRAFNVMARDVFAADSVFVTDIRGGKDKKRPENSTFVYGNGLQLPFKSESMNTVCTNFLLHMIVDSSQTVTSESSEQEIAKGLLGEAYRVLAPGGQLFMREVAPRLNYDDRECRTKYNRKRMQAFMGEMRTNLTEVGFSEVVIEASWEKTGVKYLFDESRELEKHTTIATPTSIGVYAYKAE